MWHMILLSTLKSRKLGMLPNLSGVLVKTYPALFVTEHWVAFETFTRNTRAMGRFMHLVWYDINRTVRRGRGHS